ncbi:MAG: hypothetical protein IKV81_05775 [Clostridia bacterium]|nr:hypothetical protein [Clostridia bacterium]
MARTNCTGIENKEKPPVSPLRKKYIARLVARSVIFAVCVVLLFVAPNEFEVLQGLNFFKKFSLLHILWVIWLIDMILQFMPIKNEISLGSQKLFKQRFRPIREKINRTALKKHIETTTAAAGVVMLLWALLVATIGLLYFFDVISKEILLLCSVAFYVCDLICVLIWCPFRLILKNRCCTTCRIFNWDHFMMFSPLMFLVGFYGWSLFAISLVIMLVWELSIIIYPERFWEFSNDALKCSNCTDKLCTQYCQKLRK